MKNKKILIIILIIAVISIIGIIYMLLSNTYSSKDAKKFAYEYESLNNTKREKDGKTIRSIKIPKDNPIVYSNEDEIVEKIKNKDTFLVYFGFEDCPWCRSVILNLLDAAKDLELDKIYYVNVFEIRDTIEVKDDKLETTKRGTKGYYELLKLLDNVIDDYTVTNDEGEEISTQEKRIFAPTVVAIVNGQAEKATDGISDKQTDGYMKLTDKMNKESYNKFKCVINCLIEEQNICKNDSKC